MIQCFYAFLCTLFLLTGCLPKAQISDFVPDRRLSLAQEARQAWENKDYPGSAQLYQRLLASRTLRPDQLPTAWYRMTYSALNCNNHTMARTGVSNWEAAVPNAKFDLRWLQAKFLVNTHFAPHMQQEATKNFLLRQDVMWYKKAKVIDFVSDRLWREKKYPQSLAFTRLLYAFSPAKEQKLLQAKMISFLRTLSLSELQKLEPQAVKIFPDNCLSAVLAIKQLATDNPKKRRQSYEDLRSLSHFPSWQGRFPFQQELILLKQEFGRSRQEIALLLPLSGSYSKLSQKILRGMEIGLQFLFENDFDTHVRIINSEADDWIEQIQKLPASISFIGGPLRKQIWQKIVEKHLYQRYAFFTFLPQMQKEGLYGWRFFSSPNDQIHSLIKACNTQRPDMNFAILYPAERYGEEMSRIFSDELKKNGLELKATQAYTPGRHKGWGEAVTKLLGIQPESERKKETETKTTGKTAKGKKKMWQPGFEAVFLPDSFSAARQLVPGFFYNDVRNLLFLGSQLWEEGLATKSENKYFSNSLFPSAWWRKNPSYPARFLDKMLGEECADFWAALGFDFVRFFSRMHLTEGQYQAKQINSILQKQASKMNWTLAPLLWNEQGEVRQEMYIFRPSSRQIAPLDATNENEQKPKLFQ